MSERKRKWDSGPDGSANTKVKVEDSPTSKPETATPENNGAADAAGRSHKILSSVFFLAVLIDDLNLSSLHVD
jgi:hypothetical protein